MRNISRRSLLGAAGLGLGSFWLPTVGRIQAQEQSSEPNLLFLYAEGGWVSKDTFMRPPWAPAEWSAYEFYKPGKTAPDNLEWEFDLSDSRLSETDFSRILRPLYRHRDVMTVLEGLDMSTVALDSRGDGHAQGHLHCWTAVPSVREEGVKSFSGVPSVDQRIHEHIRTTRPEHQSMDFAPMEPFHQWLYRSDGTGGATFVPTISSPRDGFDRFFRSANSSSGGSGDPLADNSRFSLDLAVQQFDEIAPRLSGTDRAKLEAHRELLSGLQRRLGQTISCDSISRPGQISGTPDDNPGTYRPYIEGFAQLVAAGFSCGISRVASIGGFMAPNTAYGLDASVAVHHEYEHESDPMGFYQLEGSAMDRLTEKTEMMVARNVVQTEAVAAVIDMLKSVPVGDGTLLDTTLVVYMSEISHGNHGHEHYPVLLFGSGGGMVTPGRYIKYPNNQPRPHFFEDYLARYSGYPVSRLLVAILQGFGVDIDYLGAPSIEGFTGTLDLSGPLPRLKA